MASKEAAVKKEVAEKKKKDKDEDDEEDNGSFAKRKYADSLKIKILNKENPHREGSKRAEAFDALKTCKTVGDFYKTGKKTKYLDDWVESGHLEEIGQG